MENPCVVDLSPQTEKEAIAENELTHLVKTTSKELFHGRHNLTADELSELRGVSPRVEKVDRIVPEILAFYPGPPNLYFFSIDGYLNGRRIKGAVFAGNCAVIREFTKSRAENLFMEGLTQTLELSRRYHVAQQAGVDLNDNGGIEIETGGSKVLN